jgi:hypothetical protein
MNTTQNTSAPSYNAVDVSQLLLSPTSEFNLGMHPFCPSPLRGFVTFYDPGWSIVGLRNAVAKKGSIFYPQSWYHTEPFASHYGPPRYRQLRMTAVPDSFNKTFVEQQAVLPIDEEIPFARVVVMGMVIQFLATGERLFPEYWVRCNDQGSDGRRVSVGGFDRDGLIVRTGWDGYRDSGIGLASARKF